MKLDASSLLEVKDLTVTYPRSGTDGVQAVVDVSLSLKPGEIVGLVGESGCGKSTFARALVGAVAPSGGNITFNDHDVKPLKRKIRPLAHRRLQMIFQDPSSSLNPRRTVGQQITDAIKLSSETSETRDIKSAEEILDLVGLPPSAIDRYPHEFSGGQRQRIAVARVLATEPLLIVADEPIAALDASAQADMANLLSELASERKIAMVFVSHDLAVVRQIAHRIDVMYLGQIVESGPTEQVWNEPAHPYTKALISAVPKLSRFGEFPQDLPGEVPDPAKPPTGCRFRPRCSSAWDQCQIEPNLLLLKSGTNVRCWLYESSGAGGQKVDVEMQKTKTIDNDSDG